MTSAGAWLPAVLSLVGPPTWAAWQAVLHSWSSVMHCPCAHACTGLGEGLIQSARTLVEPESWLVHTCCRWAGPPAYQQALPDLPALLTLLAHCARLPPSQKSIWM